MDEWSNWQVQEMDGTSISDWATKLEAAVEAMRLGNDLQRTFKVKQTY